MSGSTPAVRFACVARHSDGLIAASHHCRTIGEKVRAHGVGTGVRRQRALTGGRPGGGGAQTLSTVRKVLQSGNLKKQTKCTVTVNDAVGTMHINTTDSAAYVLVTSPTYPRRTAFTALTKLREAVASSSESEESLLSSESLSSERAKQPQLGPPLSDIASRFSEPEQDKAEQVSAQVEEVRGQMEGNIERMLENQENLDAVQEKTGNLQEGARQFRKQSNTLKSQLWWRNFKIKIIVLICVLAILAYILVRSPSSFLSYLPYISSLHRLLWCQHLHSLDATAGANISHETELECHCFLQYDPNIILRLSRSMPKRAAVCQRSRARLRPALYPGAVGGIHPLDSLAASSIRSCGANACSARGQCANNIAPGVNGAWRR